MPFSSHRATVERARPVLGTIVRMRCRGLSKPDGHELMQGAFDRIERVHRLMSFHRGDSDISRLNRYAARHAVAVDEQTYFVLKEALALSAASDGIFDITVGHSLAVAGLLPMAHLSSRPDTSASWRDIELLREGRVRFHLPLWIDLGGIAKGYAVDSAIEDAAIPTGATVLVNAGGDLRVSGPETERVALSGGGFPEDGVPLVELENASLASSEALQAGGCHIHGRTHEMMAPAFVAVLADRCIQADALTKVVLAAGLAANPVLAAFGATAFLHRPGTGWTSVGATPV